MLSFLYHSSIRRLRRRVPPLVSIYLTCLIFCTSIIRIETLLSRRLERGRERKRGINLLRARRTYFLFLAIVNGERFEFAVVTVYSRLCSGYMSPAKLSRLSKSFVFPIQLFVFLFIIQCRARNVKRREQANSSNVVIRILKANDKIRITKLPCLLREIIFHHEIFCFIPYR